MPLHRQGEEVAALLNAENVKGLPLYQEAVILEPRRASKTTAIWSDTLGKAATIPGWRCVTAAQDGLRGRAIIREFMRVLELRDFEGARNPANRMGRLFWSAGSEAIEFNNGSRIWVVKPEPGAFRSAAADRIILDEAGELSDDLSERLVAGALPLMDTRPTGQIIITGTPGETRSGLLWDRLQLALKPKAKAGLLTYRLRDDEEMVTVDDDGRLGLDRNMLRRVHPGIGTLTTYDLIASRLLDNQMTRTKFEAEYGCRWPLDASVAAISPAAWRGCRAVDDAGAPLPLPDRPDQVGIGWDVAPDSSTASLVLAWRDATGRAVLELVGYRPGTDWLPAAAERAALKFRVPAGYDQIGANQDVADVLTRSRVRVAGLTLKAMQGAAARLVREIESGNLRHYGQDDLDAAVAGAAWRTQGDGGRLFARKASTADVSPLVAASVALWQYDERARRERPVITYA